MGECSRQNTTKQDLSDTSSSALSAFPKSPLASRRRQEDRHTEHDGGNNVVIVQVGARSVNLVDAHFPQSTRRVEATLCSNVGPVPITVKTSLFTGSLLNRFLVRY